MRRILAAFLLILVAPAVSYAAVESPDMFDKALDDLVRNGYVGDTSAAERYLEAVLEQRPDHLEARWQLLYLSLVPLKSSPLSERVEALAALSPAFTELARLAKASKQEAFLHFMTAIHAGFYCAYERALSEINRAVALEPRSARYLTAKGRLEADYGKWARSDAEIENGIRILNEARELLRTHPNPFVRDEFFDFYLAAAYSDFGQPRWKEAAEHYQRFIDNTSGSVIHAFALNNVSSAYVKLGECAKAKESAEKALAFMKFGAAQWNKRYAEFCLEMQKADLIASQ